VPRSAVCMTVMMVLGQDWCGQPRANRQCEDQVANEHFMSPEVS
jgi:hypothetical protein